VSDARALVRAFLEQQRQLGGDAVILTDARSVGAPGAIARAVPAHQNASPAASRAQPERGASAPTAAPELPPPGLSYDPPTGDLFARDPASQAPSLTVLAELIGACTRCRLSAERSHAVPGEGPASARLVVVGEGPGRVEDETGRPFVGPAGELLTKILAAIALKREDVFICNIVKCRPPENRTPQYDEVAACVPYLFRQIELVKPAVILAMGSTAAQTLLNTKQSLGALRNQIHRFHGIPVIVTYHPAALLRNPNWKKPTWDDVRVARRLLD
jgi:uracil-DNA glycosylase